MRLTLDFDTVMRSPLINSAACKWAAANWDYLTKTDTPVDRDWETHCLFTPISYS